MTTRKSVLPSPDRLECAARSGIPSWAAMRDQSIPSLYQSSPSGMGIPNVPHRTSVVSNVSPK